MELILESGSDYGMIVALVALFLVYAGIVAWQMRRVLSMAESNERLREARRLLFLVSAGAPVAAILILVAL